MFKFFKYSGNTMTKKISFKNHRSVKEFLGRMVINSGLVTKQ